LRRKTKSQSYVFRVQAISEAMEKSFFLAGATSTKARDNHVSMV
jgi:hypothetical protein